MSTKRTKHAPAPKWVFACAATIPDPRVSPDSVDYGKRTVSVLYGIDSRGRLWREIDGVEPVLLGTPPG